MIITTIIFVCGFIILALAAIEVARSKIEHRAWLNGKAAGLENADLDIKRLREEAVKRGQAEWYVTNQQTGETMFQWKD